MTPLLLLDLDGTLIDSAPGILASLRTAFAANGLPTPDDATLRTFVGPPIHDSMRRHRVPPTLVGNVVADYRAAFATTGMHDATVFDGIPTALRVLRDHNIRLVVATAKPEVFARPIVEELGLADFVDGVFGAPLDEDATKGEIIARALATLDDTFPVLMVGDREHDVRGATENALDAVGVRWGYATPGELENAGAVAIVERPEDLPAITLRLLTEAA